MRRLESIQKFLEHRRDAIPLLFDGYPLEQVCTIAQKLLIDGVFISETLAEQRFPLLFDRAPYMSYGKASSNKTPSQTTCSEEGSSQNCLFERASSSLTNLPKIKTEIYRSEVTGAEKKLPSSGTEARSAREAVTLDLAMQHTGEFSMTEPGDHEITTMYSLFAVHSGEVRSQVPPPAPVYLPFATQHRILNDLQTVLEGTCFDLTLKILPDVIKARELEVPEQLELKEWVSLIMESAGHLPCSVPIDWEGFLVAAEKLQYTITRRTRTGVNSIIDFLDESIIWTEGLNDVRRAAWCQHVRAKLQSTLANIEGFENNTREMLSVQLEDIARKRAELDAMETKAIAHMMEAEKQNRVSECEITKQALLDLNAPGEKILPIRNGSELRKIKREEARNLQEHLDDNRIPDASAVDTSPEKASLHVSDLQIVKQDSGTVDQADLTSIASWDPTSHSSSTLLDNPYLFHSLPTPWSSCTEISNTQTFSKQLAAEMTPGSPTKKSSALSQKGDLNTNVKSEPNTEDDSAKPYAGAESSSFSFQIPRTS